MKTNALYYGDNLEMLREYIDDESVDLVYLDPPFNSNRDYNVIFKDESGNRSDAQLYIFDDTWHWGPRAEKTLAYLTTTSRHRGAVPSSVSTLVDALVSGIGKNQLLAYIVEMAVRLVELHRVLKPSGSLYLHCDPTASHYLKLVLDSIFGARCFRSEITWKRSHAHSDSKQGRKGYGNIADILLYYSKGVSYTFNTQYLPYDQSYIDKYYRYRDPDGRRYWLDNLTGPGGAAKGNPRYEVMGVTRYWRYSQGRMNELIERGRVVQSKPGNVPQFKRYLDEMPGVPLQNIWTDIPPINMMAKERLGWPTQKPIALLERIIATSSNPGDIVLDPFCGCGTATVAAQKTGRRWIGIDVTYLAVTIMHRRMIESFGLSDIEIIRRPTEVGWARDAMKTSEGRYEFQWWALDLVGAMPMGNVRKKGADQGIDGVITFPDRLGKMESVIVSVKGGKVSSPMVRDLVGVVQREKAAVGLFVTLEDPTSAMQSEAAKAGLFTDAGGRDYPRIQILTIDEILNQGKHPQLPAYVLPPYRRASRVPVAVGVQQQTYLDESGHPIDQADVDAAPLARRPEDSADESQPKRRSRTNRRAASSG